MHLILLLVCLGSVLCQTSSEATKSYLFHINHELSLLSALLFDPQQSTSIIQKFEQTFGVQIQLQAAFPAPYTEDCLSQVKYLVINDASPKHVIFNVPERAVFLNASVPRLLIASVGPAFDASLSLTSPTGKKQHIYDNQCGAQLDLYAAFEDGGVSYEDSTCSYIFAGSETFQPTQPFSSFSGDPVKGDWTFRVAVSSFGNVELRWKICYAYGGPVGRLDRDFAVANLNRPAYSNANGIARLTSVFRNTFGGALYVTIIKNEYD